MVKAEGVSFRDGDFRKDFPAHSVRAEEIGGTWYVFECGPRYANTYKVTSYDDEGLKRLRAIETRT